MYNFKLKKMAGWLKLAYTIAIVTPLMVHQSSKHQE
jgi:hypothetical protein